VDELLTAGITPTLTLYHWDLPVELDAVGGWTNRDTAYRFAEYAAVVAEALGDRVPTWITLNEPWCSAFLGYAGGEHAPGRTEPAEAFSAAHHLLLGHGLAARELRRILPEQAQISITLNPGMVRANTDAAEDRAAAAKYDGLQTRMWTDPLFRGTYPADVQEFTSAITDWSFVQPGDLEIISTPIDLLGVNFYNPGTVEHTDAGGGSDVFPGCDDVRGVEWFGERTAMGWPVEETGFYELLVRLHTDYRIPLVVTENGAAYEDTVSDSGEVHDAARVSYLHRHLGQVHRAIADGVDLRGYFVWSMLDNFEWAWGYDKRFGIVRVDFDTQLRTIKDSGRFYASVVQANALPPL
jgi:beta-glucosidase